MKTMATSELEKLKFPIGKYTPPEKITSENISQWISEIDAVPERLEKLLEGITEEQLEIPYRPDGWTVRQVVNHLADSHMNSIIRFKLAITEDSPTIRPYFEDRWAELKDSKNDPIDPSIAILKGVHQRWVSLLKSFSGEDWERIFVHPEFGEKYSLAYSLGLYAWHGNHHIAHIEQALNQ